MSAFLNNRRIWVLVVSFFGRSNVCIDSHWPSSIGQDTYLVFEMSILAELSYCSCSSLSCYLAGRNNMMPRDILWSSALTAAAG